MSDSNSLSLGWSRLLNWLQGPLSRIWFVRLGHLGFLGLLFLSIYYYRERMLHLDTSFYAFRMLVDGDFFTGHDRYVTYPYQLLPLLVMQLGGSLKAVIISQSMSFVLLPWLVYTLLVHGLRSLRVGIWLLLAMILTVRYKFYGPVGEIVTSIPFLALLLGWLDRQRFDREPRWVAIAVGVVLALPLLGAHPFSLISLAVVFGFYMLWEWRDLDWKTFLSVSIIVAILLAWWFWPDELSDYGQQRVGPLANLSAMLEEPDRFFVVQLMGEYWRKQYVLPGLVFVLAIIGLMRRRRWLVALYSVLMLAAVTLLVMGVHSYLNNRTYIMIDGYLAHIGLVAALPIAFLWTKPGQRYGWLLLALLIGFSLHRIHAVHPFFTKREAKLVEKLEAYTSPEQPKAVVPYEVKLVYDTLWMDWAMPFETLLLTGLDGPEHVRTIDVYTPFEDKYGKYWLDPYFFSQPVWGNIADGFRSNELPERYFQLPPTVYVDPPVE